MKLKKNFEKRLKNADFYQLFIIDDKGVGYASQSSKRGLPRNVIIAFIKRLEKEKQYLIELLEEGKIKRVS